MQPGRPCFGRGTNLGGGSTEGVRGLLGVASLHSPAAVAASADADAELRGDRAHLGKLDLELLGGPLVLDLPATVRATRRQRYVDLPVGNPNRSHAMAVATMSITPATTRTCRLLFRVAFGERSRLSLSRTTGVGKEPFQLCDTGVALAEALVQLGELGRVALEHLSQTGDLVDQLLVRVGF